MDAFAEGLGYFLVFLIGAASFILVTSGTGKEYRNIVHVALGLGGLSGFTVVLATSQFVDGSRFILDDKVFNLVAAGTVLYIIAGILFVASVVAFALAIDRHRRK